MKCELQQQGFKLDLIDAVGRLWGSPAGIKTLHVGLRMLPTWNVNARQFHARHGSSKHHIVWEVVWQSCVK